MCCSTRCAPEAQDRGVSLRHPHSGLDRGHRDYLIEGAHNPGFSSIPQSIYWGIVTITTVGYGDVAPLTVAGKILASLIMLTGFSIIAVPTGIVTAELGREIRQVGMDRRRCVECGWNGHDPAANYCKHCGHKL